LPAGLTRLQMPRPRIAEAKRMQLILIIAFGLLLAMPEAGPQQPPFQGATQTLLVSAAMVVTLIGITFGGCRTVLKRLSPMTVDFAAAARAFGRTHTALRTGLLLMLTAQVTQTDWLSLVRFRYGLGTWPLLDELVLLAPIVLTALACWTVLYPADKALRAYANAAVPGAAFRRPVWTFAQYMDFQIRHQILTVLVPISPIFLTYDLISGYEEQLYALTGLPWAGDGLLVCIAGLVFLVSPEMLKAVWRTQPMPPGPLRSRLETLCERIKLQYRDILVWKSHGVMANAAVMGLLPRVRYILLSDGLLENLSLQQIEAAFGHEAGHIKHRHIPYYLIFAVASMLAVSVGIYYVDGTVAGSEDYLDLYAAGMLLLIWAVCFGWISRRFERQADIFAVRILSETIPICPLPCWLHTQGVRSPLPVRPLCTTAANIFAEALEAVAALNGISRWARSWRHSSIAARQAFVRKAAERPEVLAAFEKNIRIIKGLLVVSAISLQVWAMVLYWPQLMPQRPRPRYRLAPPVLVRSVEAWKRLCGACGTEKRNADLPIESHLFVQPGRNVVQTQAPHQFRLGSELIDVAEQQIPARLQSAADILEGAHLHGLVEVHKDVAYDSAVDGGPSERLLEVVEEKFDHLAELGL